MTSRYGLCTMVTSALKKLLPTKVKIFLSNLENFLRFDLYAYHIAGSRVRRLLKQRKQPSQYLFILGPARSGSSLLVKVLNSHPQISGYGESHECYDSAFDLEKLIYRTSVILDDFDPIGHTYVMDKIVWNYRLSDEILNNKQIKFVFLLRDPIATCMSALKCSSVPEFKNVNSWMHYYQKRLTFLANVATKINDPSRCLTLQYEDLLGNTDQVLASFQKFLGTALPLSDHYTVSQGGRFKYGDNSSSITSGKILRKQVKPLQVDESLFSADQQQTIAKLQGDCNKVLSVYSQSASGVGSVGSTTKTSVSAVRVSSFVSN